MALPEWACEQCGGDEVVKLQGVSVCKDCGMVVTELRQLEDEYGVWGEKTVLKEAGPKKQMKKYKLPPEVTPSTWLSRADDIGVIFVDFVRFGAQRLGLQKQVTAAAAHHLWDCFMRLAHAIPEENRIWGPLHTGFGRITAPLSEVIELPEVDEAVLTALLWILLAQHDPTILVGDVAPLLNHDPQQNRDIRHRFILCQPHKPKGSYTTPCLRKYGRRFLYSHVEYALLLLLRIGLVFPGLDEVALLRKLHKEAAPTGAQDSSAWFAVLERAQRVLSNNVPTRSVLCRFPEAMQTLVKKSQSLSPYNSSFLGFSIPVVSSAALVCASVMTGEQQRSGLSFNAFRSIKLSAGMPEMIVWRLVRILVGITQGEVQKWDNRAPRQVAFTHEIEVCAYVLFMWASRSVSFKRRDSPPRLEPKPKKERKTSVHRAEKPEATEDPDDVPLFSLFPESVRKEVILRSRKEARREAALKYLSRRVLEKFYDALRQPMAKRDVASSALCSTQREDATSSDDSDTSSSSSSSSSDTNQSVGCRSGRSGKQPSDDSTWKSSSSTSSTSSSRNSGLVPDNEVVDGVVLPLVVADSM